RGCGLATLTSAPEAAYSEAPAEPSPSATSHCPECTAGSRCREDMATSCRDRWATEDCPACPSGPGADRGFPAEAPTAVGAIPAASRAGCRVEDREAWFPARPASAPFPLPSDQTRFLPRALP